MNRLIIDGNTVYEIDEECENMKKQAGKRRPAEYGNDHEKETGQRRKQDHFGT